MIKTLSQAYAAGVPVKYSIPASNFRLLTLSLAAPVTIRFYKNGSVVSEAVDMLDGFAQEDQPFDAVEIVSATAQTVVVVIADGHVKYDRFSGSVSVTNFPAAVAVNGPMSNAGKTVTNASAQLLAANASRRFLMIQNKDAAGNIFVTLDGSAATTANGVKIVPGGSLILDIYTPTGAVMAIGDIASNANIVVVEG